MTWVYKPVWVPGTGRAAWAGMGTGQLKVTRRKPTPVSRVWWVFLIKYNIIKYNII